MGINQVKVNLPRNYILMVSSRVISKGDEALDKFQSGFAMIR